MQPVDMNAHPAEDTLVHTLLSVCHIDDIQDLHLELSNSRLTRNNILISQQRVMYKVAWQADVDATDRLVLVLEQIAEERRRRQRERRERLLLFGRKGNEFRSHG